MSIFRKFIETASRALRTESAYALTLRLTLAMFLLYGTDSVLAAVPVRIVGIFLLVFPGMLYTSPLWWLLTAFLGLGIVLDWHAIDNHKYLIAYWGVACSLSLSYAGGEQAWEYLRMTARVSVGLVFLCATAWKIVAGQYVDGSFLYFTFIADPRLAYVGSAVSGLGIDTIRLTQDVYGYVGRLGVLGATVPVFESKTLSGFAFVLSWMTLLGEGATALTHLSNRRSMYQLRHLLLVTFIALTYLLVPVIGFAYVLAIMGFAQCKESDVHGRIQYLLLLALAHLMLLPWQRVLDIVF